MPKFARFLLDVCLIVIVICFLLHVWLYSGTAAANSTISSSQVTVVDVSNWILRE